MRWLVIALLFVTTAVVAQQASQLWGLVYLSSAPTLADKQTAAWRGSSSAQLSTDIVAGCNGAINLSSGCVQPMLGGL